MHYFEPTLTTSVPNGTWFAFSSGFGFVLLGHVRDALYKFIVVLTTVRRFTHVLRIVTDSVRSFR